MGDVVLTTPLLSYLKNRNPETEITLVTGLEYAELFKDDPRVVSVVPYSRNNEENIFSDLASKKWDRIIDLQNNHRSRHLLKKKFSRTACGTFNKYHLKRFFLLFFRVNFYRTYSSVAERYILASDISPKDSGNVPPLKVYCNDDSIQKHELFHDEDSKVIAFFPFSAWKNKQWPAVSYAAIGKYFIKKDWNVALFGGPEDRNGAAILRREIGGNCYSFAGTLSLYEIGCYLSHCTLALGGDTGLTHLARACGVRTGILYGSTSRHFGFFPYGDPPYKIFESKQFCRPCHPHGGNICWRVSRPCLKKIKERDIIDGLEDLIVH